MIRALKTLLFTAVIVVAGVANAENVTITGAGSSFVAPIMQQWAETYNKAHSAVKVDYQGKGSGVGIAGITDKTLDFAASDAPMSEKEIAAAGGNVINVPVIAGAVVAIYNVPGAPADLKLDGVVLAEIFQGKIKNWNDAKITAANPDAKLPDQAITIVCRSDSSGTSYIFSSYLATQSDEFLEKVGASKAPKWPAGGQAAKGNPGVAQAVQNSVGAIGYVELNYAVEKKLQYAMVKNAEGEFIKATPESTSLAGDAAAASMKDTLVSRLWNRKGKGTYPICGLVYVLVRTDLTAMGQAKAEALVDFLQWSTHEGQKSAASLSYAPLSTAMQTKVGDALGKIKTK